MRLNRRCALAVLIFSASLAAADTAPLVIAPPYMTGDVQIVSPRGLHIATVTMQGSRRVVMLDGVAGPAFDDILPAAATIQDVYGPAGDITSRNLLSSPVVFSSDGAHVAYAARDGKDALVLLDGKEIFRAPFSPAQPAVQLLRFSPDGRHTLFLTPTTDTMNSTALVIDGKPQLPTQNGAFPVWSEDGAHYAYVATGPRDNKPFLVIDGQVAPYFGDRPRFTAGGKLVTLLRGDGTDVVQVDGKPLLSAKSIKSLHVSPTEDKVAAIVTNDGGKTYALFFNDQPVPGTDGATAFTFSPDGKHWTLQCVQSPSTWMLIDGKKGQSYTGLSAPIFTADSSKIIYVADSGNKHFVVVNGVEEAGGMVVRVQPKTAGGHYAYVIGDNLGAMSVVYDGTAAPPGPDVMDVLLSDDGRHYGYFAKGGIMDYTIAIDGKPAPGTGGDYRQILFAGDHYATMASPPKGYKTLLVDGRFVPIVNGIQPGEPLFFTPGGQHLFVRRNEPTTSGAPVLGVYLDGKKVADFDGYSRNWARTILWENNADGTVTLIGGQPTPGKPGPVVKITVDPKIAGTSANGFIDNAVAEQAALDKQAADAAAAKKKAADDAAAARAQAKADAAAAKAQAKADAAAARAARKKK